jgi:hypothetical protein
MSIDNKKNDNDDIKISKKAVRKFLILIFMVTLVVSSVIITKNYIKNKYDKFEQATNKNVDQKIEEAKKDLKTEIEKRIREEVSMRVSEVSEDEFYRGYVVKVPDKYVTEVSNLEKQNHQQEGYFSPIFFDYEFIGGTLGSNYNWKRADEINSYLNREGTYVRYNNGNLRVLEKINDIYLVNFKGIYPTRITLGGYWNPITKNILSQKNVNNYDELVINYLKHKGIYVKNSGIKQIVRVRDLDGSGNEINADVYVVATNLDSPNTNESRFSIVLKRRIIDENEITKLDKQRNDIEVIEEKPGIYVASTLLEGSFGNDVSKLYYIPYILDLNGDGEMEVIVSYKDNSKKGNNVYKINGYYSSKVLSE